MGSNKSHNVKSTISSDDARKRRGEHPYGAKPPTQASVVRDPENKDPLKLNAKATMRDLGSQKKSTAKVLFSNLDESAAKQPEATHKASRKRSGALRAFDKVATGLTKGFLNYPSKTMWKSDKD